MCGICGKYSVHPEKVDSEIITRMCDAIKYRGPDDSGTWVSDAFSGGRVGLGHRRLSIIDLSEAGQQPMCNEDGRIRLVFNGEIYNYREIRKELLKLGHRFRSETDTEAIIHLYEEVGIEGCLKRLKGMFAFGLWDSRTGRLILCRDRLGIKPLVYYRNSEFLIFASEIKAILEDPDVVREIDWEALGLYLSLNYIPAPWTIFKGMKKLEPGQYLIGEKESVSVHRYWEVEPARQLKAFGDDSGDRKRRLFDLLERAVERRLISDVPLGAFLSGGIDSSIVVGLMARLMDGPVKTFSIGYKDLPLYDETDYARQVADLHKTDHHEFRLSHRDVLDVIPDVLDNFDEPFADSSAIPTFIVSRETRREVTVALSGDGADELFAGYRKYTGEYWFKYYSLLPETVREKWVKTLLGKIPQSRDTRMAEYVRRADKFVQGAQPLLTDRVWLWREVFRSGQIRDVLLPEAFNRIDVGLGRRLTEDGLNRYDSDTINRMLYLDVTGSLPDDMLNKVDRMSMMCGLEVRVPFLDHEVVEFVFGLEGAQKLHRSRRKYILLETFKELLPRSLLNRPKWGFEIPISVWLKKELRYLCDTYLAPDFIRAQGIFDSESLERLVAEHLSGRVDRSWQIWNLIVIGHWYQRYFMH